MTEGFHIDGTVSPIPGFLSFNLKNVGALFKPEAAVGNFLLISRFGGLALDNALRIDQWSQPHLWPAHGEKAQQWNISKVKGEELVSIVSSHSGLALDSQKPTGNGKKLIMREPNGELWQQWKIAQRPSGAYSIRSAHARRVIDVGETPRRG